MKKNVQRVFSANDIADVIKGHFTRSELSQKESLVASFASQLSDIKTARRFESDSEFNVEAFVKRTLLESEVYNSTLDQMVGGLGSLW